MLAWKLKSFGLTKGCALEIPAGFGSQESEVRSATAAGYSHGKTEDVEAVLFRNDQQRIYISRTRRNYKCH
jgi:hypothetical protein